MAKSIRPLGDKVLVKRMDVAEKTEGGIIIPESSTEKPLEGTVVAVGKGRVDEEGKTIPLTLKKGDKILFNKYGESEISVENEELLILEEADVLAVLVNTAK
jgi:chaperonin GroES